MVFKVYIFCKTYKYNNIKFVILNKTILNLIFVDYIGNYVIKYLGYVYNTHSSIHNS